MVCAKCQKKSQHTSLATPEVKKKNDMYLGSPAGSSSKAGTKTSATLGNNGIGKVSPGDIRLSRASDNYYESDEDDDNNDDDRVNYCQNRPGILMLHTRQPARVRSAAPRLTRAENTA